MTIAYLNGQYLPLSEARVPVLDRGYLFGDGVYEVIPAYAGQVFRLDAHLQRLARSLEDIQLHNPLKNDEWRAMIHQLLIHEGIDQTDQAIYLQVSRGVTETRAHGLPRNPTPTVLAFTWPLRGVSAEVQSNGVSAITSDDYRWHRCNIKAIALLANVMLANEALRQGHNETILHRDGMVTEGASSNVFAVIDGRIVTPVTSQFILQGITRAFILELISEAGLTCEERDLTLDELQGADEIWVSSSTRELFPVTMLDDRPVGDGKPGALWHRIYDLYQIHKLD